MAKTPAVNPEVKEPVNNGLNLSGISLAAYKFAGGSSSQKSLAVEIYGFVPNWLEGNIDKTTMAQVDRGLLLRHKENTYAEYGYAEINGSKHFVLVSEVIDGSVTPTIDPELRNKCSNIMRLDSDHALSYTGQEFGNIKKIDGDIEKYDAIKLWRVRGSKYMSNVKREITSKIKSIVSPEVKGRAVIADFTDHAIEVFGDLKKRCKTSLDARGDTTANPDKFDKGIKAFWVAYK